MSIADPGGGGDLLVVLERPVDADVAGELDPAGGRGPVVLGRGQQAAAGLLRRQHPVRPAAGGTRGTTGRRPRPSGLARRRGPAGPGPVGEGGERHERAPMAMSGMASARARAGRAATPADAADAGDEAGLAAEPLVALDGRLERVVALLDPLDELGVLGRGAAAPRPRPGGRSSVTRTRAAAAHSAVWSSVGQAADELRRRGWRPGRSARSKRSFRRAAARVEPGVGEQVDPAVGVGNSAVTSAALVDVDDAVAGRRSGGRRRGGGRCPRRPRRGRRSGCGRGRRAARRPGLSRSSSPDAGDDRQARVEVEGEGVSVLPR